MAIHTEQINQVAGGFAKTIEADSMRLVFDNLQRTQYQYPYKSTVRELASNGIDAIRERDIARSILEGKTTVEQHYVKLEGEVYKDSYFNPSYYDLKHLGTDPNVYITYQEGSALAKDKLIIRDNGVGLWGRRLVGYFQLAYSTKRLSRFGLGKFGIGAKAALSTGVPFYTVINRYNGMEMHFNVYSYQVEPAIPKFNMATGQENPHLVLDTGGDGTVCYYLPTTEPNGLEVILEVKKHHKQQYIDAVKSQLLYFENIVFRVEAATGVVEEIPVKAKILYEDDLMIISDNNLYSKPHILINKVNYGNIDFRELELEDKLGNISIKMTGEEVSVSPSRENVIWDEYTREAIVKRFKEVQSVGQKILQGELDQEDFMRWMRACIAVRSTLGAETGRGIVSRLSKIVDLQDYVPVYKPDPEFKLNYQLFAGMKVRKIYGKHLREGSTTKWKIEREQIGLMEFVSSGLPVLVQQEGTSTLRDRYLMEVVYPDGYITIWLNKTDPDPLPEEATDEDRQFLESQKLMLRKHALDTAKELKWLGNDLTEYQEADLTLRAEKVLNRWRRLNKYILSSADIQHYESFEVPENFTSKIGEEGDEDVLKQEDEVQSKEARQSAEERRKLQGKTVLFTPRVVASEYGNKPMDLYIWHKMEIPVASIDQWNNEEVYYSSEDTASLLQLAAFITRPDNHPYARHHWEVERDEIVNVPTNNPPVTNRVTYELVSHLTHFGEPTSLKGPQETYWRNARPDYDEFDPLQVRVKLIKVAQNRVKFYRDFKHIQQFFAQVKNKTITMSNSLIRWNTARYVHKHMPQLAFLNGFSQFNEEYARLYQSLKRYCAENYREVGQYAAEGKYKAVQDAEYTDMIRHLDKVTELQLFVREHPSDPQAIANVVKELFGTDSQGLISDGCGIDTNIYDIVHKLLDYAEPLHVMLNQLPVLTDGGVIPSELETEIRNYIDYKRAMPE